MGGATIERHAYARIGLLGNPSDGYFGRALSVAISNFQVSVTLQKSADLRIQPSADTTSTYGSIPDLVDSITRSGYRGHHRLVMATIKTFHDYCARISISLPARSFTAHYNSSIPRQVGLAGSSAIVTAMLRALMAFFEIDIPREKQPTLVLAAEADELGITAGLQDRVAQVYQALVYMDLSEDLMRDLGHGLYETLDPALLPGLYVAHRTDSTKVSGSVLDEVRNLWEQGDAVVCETLDRIAALATRGREALLLGDHAKFAALMDENFDLRSRIMRIDPQDLALIAAARSLGASAKLAGSGGAVVGAYQGDRMKEQLGHRLGALGARVIEPAIAEEGPLS